MTSTSIRVKIVECQSTLTVDCECGPSECDENYNSVVNAGFEIPEVTYGTYSEFPSIYGWNRCVVDANKVIEI